MTNILYDHYHDLSEPKKTILRTKWYAQFNNSERNFYNRLKKPKPEDYVFFSQLLDISLDNLMKPLFTPKEARDDSLTTSGIVAEKLGLAK